MAATWQNTGLIMLRTILNDAGCDTNKYTTERLQQLLVTAAYFLPLDINFVSTYTVDVEAQTISPDPMQQDDGAAFINFMVLKAACMADEGNFRTAALLQGVTARCGPAALDTRNHGEYLKALLSSGPCRMYEELSTQYNFSYDGGQVLKAVMSPFVSNDFYVT